MYLKTRYYAVSPIRFLKYRAYQETLIFKYPFSDKKKTNKEKKNDNKTSYGETRVVKNSHYI